MIEYGADVNGLDSNGNVLIVRMAEAGSLSGVKLLVYNGADLDKVSTGDDDEGIPLSQFTALMLAAQNFSYGNTNADSNKVNPIVEFLVRKGANVNATDENLHTPLHYAVKYESSLTNVKYLLAHGANINAQSEIGGTPLMMSVATQQKQIVSLLLNFGADPTIKDKDGKTAYQLIEIPEKELRFHDRDKVHVQKNQYYKKDKEVSDYQIKAFRSHGIRK